MMKRIIAMIAASISCMIMLAQDLQFNQCADARTLRNESLPRWDKMLDDMFAEMKVKGIKRLIVDAQYHILSFPLWRSAAVPSAKHWCDWYHKLQVLCAPRQGAYRR